MAAKMKTYVADRKQQKPHSRLLFIILVGDNFYWNGVSDNRFELTWKDIYGELATDVPWFVIMGNHDFGNSDPSCLCPFFNPRMTCSGAGSGCGGAAPFSTAPQSYACNQLNVEKGGIGGNTRSNFHMPDFTYFYTIPELDFEMIAVDYNYYDFDGLGGNGYGPTGGARDVAKVCGGTDRVHSSLESIRNASNKILEKRAQLANSTNVAIFSHYPDWPQDNINLRGKFLSEVDSATRDSLRVLNFFGHTHIQQCEPISVYMCQFVFALHVLNSGMFTARHFYRSDFRFSPSVFGLTEYNHGEEGRGYDGCTDFLTGGAGGCSEALVEKEQIMASQEST